MFHCILSNCQTHLLQNHKTEHRLLHDFMKCRRHGTGCAQRRQKKEKKKNRGEISMSVDHNSPSENSPLWAAKTGYVSQSVFETYRCVSLAFSVVCSLKITYLYNLGNLMATAICHCLKNTHHDVVLVWELLSVHCCSLLADSVTAHTRCKQGKL